MNKKKTMKGITTKIHLWLREKNCCWITTLEKCHISQQISRRCLVLVLFGRFLSTKIHQSSLTL